MACLGCDEGDFLPIYPYAGPARGMYKADSYGPNGVSMPKLETEVAIQSGEHSLASVATPNVDNAVRDRGSRLPRPEESSHIPPA